MPTETLNIAPLVALADGEARSELDRAIADLEAARKKLQSMEAEFNQSKSELKRIVEIRTAEHTECILSDTPPPSRPRREEKIAKLRDRFKGLRPAIPVQRDRIAAAEQRVSEARLKLADSFIPALADFRLTALERCRAPLDTLYRCLADAAAIDRLQDRLVGREFSVPADFDQRGLFRGSILLTKLQAGMTPQLRQLLPADLTDIDQYVDTIVTDLFNQLEVTTPQTTVRN